MTPDANASITGSVTAVVTHTSIVPVPLSVNVTLTHTNSSTGTSEDVVYTIPLDEFNPGTEVHDFVAAIVDPIPNESGDPVRRLHFRLLTALASLGRLPGFTVTP